MFLRIDVLWPAVAAAVNRNETGQKTTVYAGITRARWSSQSQKAVTRREFRARLDKQFTAVRTRRWEEIADRLTATGWPPLLAGHAAHHVYMLATGGDGSAMVLVRDDFADIAAQSILDHAEAVRDAIALAIKKPGKDADEEATAFYKLYTDRKKTVQARFTDPTTGKDAKRAHQEAVTALIDTILAAEGNVDIAFNGRMIAENDGYNIDAAVHLGHAISVDPWGEANLDYFTAIDQLTGKSGMLDNRPNGTVLYFRTATIDLTRAHATLGGTWADIVDYASAWADAFCRALPVSMQSSTMATSAPIMAAATAAPAPLTNLVPFCAEPITGRYQYPTAATRLLDWHQAISDGFGTPAVMHYWTPMSLDRDTDTERLHPSWDRALAEATAQLHTERTDTVE